MRAVPATLVAFFAFALPAAAEDRPPAIVFTTGSVISMDRTDLVVVDFEGLVAANLTPDRSGQYEFDHDFGPSWSPDGTRLAFVAHRGPDSEEIYVMRADGADQRRLTFDSGGGRLWNVDPAWSPDGARIAFRKAASSGDELWVMNADGSAQRQLTRDGRTKTRPAWSPDGTRILFQRGNEVAVVEAESGTTRTLTPPGSFETSPAWSPDGSRVALVSDGRIVVVNPDGTGRHVVTATIAAGGPAWSADGTRLAFTGARRFPERADRFGVPTLIDLFTVAVDGHGERRLTGSLSEGFAFQPSGGDPRWWPDGSRLFFTSLRDEDGSGATTFVMNVDGTCEQRFGPAGVRLLDPVWRPGVRVEPARLRCVDLRLQAALDRRVAALGGQALLGVTIENDGTEEAADLRLSVKLDRGAARLEQGMGSCAGAGSLVCKLPALAPGSTTHVVLALRSSTAGRVNIAVEATSGAADPDPMTNRATATVAVLPCRIVGTEGGDRIVGTPGPDTICGLPGWDVIHGRAGGDRIDGGSGNDTVVAGAGWDTVLGGGGWDTILVRDGQRDAVWCGSERDVVVADRLDRVARDCESVDRR